MSTESATETTTETVAAEVKPAAKKPAVKKTTARKPAAKKPAARKTAAKKAPAKKEEKKPFKLTLSNFKFEDSKAKIKASAGKAQEKFKESADMAQTVVKTVVYAQLGVYGKIYDEFSSRIESTRTEVPKQWDSLVKRGEKIQKDFDKSQDEIKAKIKDIHIKESMEKLKTSTKDSISKVKGFGKKAA